MRVDSRGVERGKCTKCDYEEYDEAKDGQNECGYCGCFPAQHERSRSESSECQDIAEEEVPKTEEAPKSIYLHRSLQQFLGLTSVVCQPTFSLIISSQNLMANLPLIL